MSIDIYLRIIFQMDLEEAREMLPGLEDKKKTVRVHPAPEKGLRWRWVSTEQSL